MDYIIYHNYLQIKRSWKNVVIIHCELDRTQKQMIFMLSTENNCLAGFMLTGNRSMFFDTDGCKGWLYQCPKRKSSLKIIDQCYDRISIQYKGRQYLSTLLLDRPILLLAK